MCTGDDNGNSNDNEGEKVEVVGELGRVEDGEGKDEVEVEVEEKVEVEVEERMFFGEFFAMTASSIIYRRVISFSIFVSSFSYFKILHK